ncbi:hypothetical protein MTO96_026495 [Rhipicephalus appendiculatus]
MCGQAAPTAPPLDETLTTPPEHSLARHPHRPVLIGEETLQHRGHGRHTGGQVPSVLLWRSRQRYCEPQRIHEKHRCHYARDDRDRQDPGTLHRDRDEHPALADQPHTVRHTLHAALRGLDPPRRIAVGSAAPVSWRAMKMAVCSQR